MSQECQPLSREQLAEKLQWHYFPQAIQERLFEHYQHFQHDGNVCKAEMDIQSASNALFWSTLGALLGKFIGEHEFQFGVDSTRDLSAIAQELSELQRQPNPHQSVARSVRYSTPAFSHLNL